MSMESDQCNDPQYGSLVTDYILATTLNDEDSQDETVALSENLMEEIEGHLADCPSCGNKYRTILKVRYTARQQRLQDSHFSRDL